MDQRRGGYRPPRGGRSNISQTYTNSNHVRGTFRNSNDQHECIRLNDGGYEHRHERRNNSNREGNNYYQNESRYPEELQSNSRNYQRRDDCHQRNFDNIVEYHNHNHHVAELRDSYRNDGWNRQYDNRDQNNRIVNPDYYQSPQHSEYHSERNNRSYDNTYRNNQDHLRNERYHHNSRVNYQNDDQRNERHCNRNQQRRFNGGDFEYRDDPRYFMHRSDRNNEDQYRNNRYNGRQLQRDNVRRYEDGFGRNFNNQRHNNREQQSSNSFASRRQEYVSFGGNHDNQRGYPLMRSNNNPHKNESKFKSSESNNSRQLETSFPGREPIVCQANQTKKENNIKTLNDDDPLAIASSLSSLSPSSEQQASLPIPSLSVIPASIPAFPSDVSLSPVDSVVLATAKLKIAPEQMIQSTSKEESGQLFCDAPMKPANRHDKKQVNLITNFFKMEVVSKIVYRYDVHLKVHAADGTTKDLTKTRSDNASRMESHETCLAAIKAALEVYKLIRDNESVIYDQASVLFASENLEAALKPHSNTLWVSIASLPEKIRRRLNILPNAENVSIEITPCRMGYEKFNIVDFEKAQKNRDLAHLDKTWQQFFDMLTNQPAINGGNYTAFGAGQLFPKNCSGTNMGRGMERKTGIDKGIVFIQPINEDMLPALVLDTKIGSFFKSQNVSLTVYELLGWHTERAAFPFKSADWTKVNNFIRGIRLTFLNSEHESSIVASGISNEPIDQLIEEGIFKKKHPVLAAARFKNHDLSSIKKNWPAIVVKGYFGNEINVTYYPMELLMVTQNQRVPISKLDDKIPVATKVQERFERINRMIAELNLDSSNSQNRILLNFGVHMIHKATRVDGIIRPPPSIMSKDNQINQVDPEKASFKLGKFIEPGRLDCVVIGHDCGANIIVKMKNSLFGAAKKQGIEISNCFLVDVTRINSLKDKIKHVFEHAKEKKTIFMKTIVIYVDDEKLNSHGYLKFFERVELIVSQHCTIRVANDIPMKRQTCSNFLNKLNIKIGGTNYQIVPDEYSKQQWIVNGKSLIIGYDVAHPTGREDKIGKKPSTSASVVGFSFNGALNPETFIGDFHYQSPRREQVGDEILIDRVKWILELFLENRKKVPENIFIIRDGVSEGQYKMVLQNEFEAIQTAIEEFMNKKEYEMPEIRQWKPKFVLAIVCKRHRKRFAREIEGKIKNVLPGTVIDSDVIRVDMTHFYMAPHVAYQGTTKLPSYHILKNDMAEVDKTQDKLQSFFHALAFNHQISSGSISLPEPVYQADEWAKRGNDLWKVYEELRILPRLKEWNRNIYSEPPIDYECMTKELCFKDTCLQQIRVNA